MTDPSARCLDCGGEKISPYARVCHLCGAGTESEAQDSAKLDKAPTSFPMLKVKKSIVANAPIDQVFNYLLDFRRHSEWDLDIGLEAVSVSPRQIAVGFT